MTLFYTIGYEGLIIDAFVALVAQHSIERVIDVRRLPLSRKPGFSKTRLSAALAEQSIAYSHLAALGTPRPLLEAVRQTHDYAAFFIALDAHLDQQPQALAEAEALIRQQRCALLCVEARPEHCHRRSVAEHLVAQAPDLAVEHILF